MRWVLRWIGDIPRGSRRRHHGRLVRGGVLLLGPRQLAHAGDSRHRVRGGHRAGVPAPAASRMDAGRVPGRLRRGVRVVDVDPRHERAQLASRGRRHPMGEPGRRPVTIHGSATSTIAPRPTSPRATTTIAPSICASSRRRTLIAIVLGGRGHRAHHAELRLRRSRLRRRVHRDAQGEGPELLHAGRLLQAVRARLHRGRRARPDRRAHELPQAARRRVRLSDCKGPQENRARRFFLRLREDDERDAGRTRSSTTRSRPTAPPASCCTRASTRGRRRGRGRSSSPATCRTTRTSWAGWINACPLPSWSASPASTTAPTGPSATPPSRSASGPRLPSRPGRARIEAGHGVSS